MARDEDLGLPGASPASTGTQVQNCQFARLEMTHPNLGFKAGSSGLQGWVTLRLLIAEHLQGKR